MTCTFTTIGGARAIVCTTHRARQRACFRQTCTALTEYLCDGCDRPVCVDHRVSLPDDQDFCGECSRPVWERWRALGGSASFLVDFFTWAEAHPEAFEGIKRTRAGEKARRVGSR